MSIKVKIANLMYWFKGLHEDPVELFKNLNIESSDDILEIGCATGFYTEALSKVADKGKIYAVDISEDFTSYVKKNSDDNVETICRSAEKINFADDSVDKIVCFNTLHELTDAEEALEVWSGILKQEGKFLYRDPEISAKDIIELSEGDLKEVDEVENVHSFRIV